MTKTPKRLKTIVFPGGFNWPLFVAQRQGFLAARGLEVELIPTTNSKQQMAGLIDGDYDIAMTAFDNVVAYNAGQGEAPTKAESDVVAVMGADSGFLHLVAQGGIDTVAALKGRRIGVDALTTGYAFVLLRLLEDAGVARGEVDFVEAGGVMARFGALLNGAFDATLLVSPFDAAARAQGFASLASGSAALGAYQGVVAGVRRDWAQENAGAVQGYIAAWREALDWLFDLAHREAAIAVLREELPNMSAELAAASYGILLDPETGFYRDAALNLPGVETVLELRRAYGAAGADLGRAADHLDSHYWEAVAG